MKTSAIVADRPPDVKEIHIVWMTTGLGCDGDSVSITAAVVAEHRRRYIGRDSRSAEGASSQPGPGL